TRRHFFQECAVGLGSLALALLLNEGAEAAPREGRQGPLRGHPPNAQGSTPAPLSPHPPHFPARAKRVVYMLMSGGPSQLDLFDPKPKLRELNGQETPKSLVEGKRFAFLKPDAKLLGSPRQFHRHGKSGAELSELLPHLGGIADEICLVR